MYLEYDGWWKDNEFHSCPKDKKDKTDLRYKANKITYGDGDVYEGEVSFGRKDGFGILTGTNGTYYEGKWRNGKRHGFGKEKAFKVVNKETGKKRIYEGKCSYSNGEPDAIALNKCCVIM